MENAGDIADRLYHLMIRLAHERTVADARIGDTYIAILLDDGLLGLSAVPKADIPPECPPFPPQETLIG